DAPNICTIGYGEHLETIKYENKSNGVLQNVTRGIEGTPRAWQAGTEVARFFTAYDHNAIIDDFIAHKAETATKAELQHIQNEVETKADKLYVDSTKRDKSVPIYLNDVSPEFLAAVEGGEGTSFNLLSIPRKSSVSVGKTDFVKILSDNLFDKNNVLSQTTIDPTLGHLIPNDTHCLSMYISAEPSQSYTYNRVQRVAYYTESYEFIGTKLISGSVETTLMTPENTGYIRVVVKENSTLNVAQVNKGDVLLPYDEYEIGIDKLKVSGKNIYDISIGKEDTTFIRESSTNIFNKFNVLEGKALSATTGEYVDNDIYSSSRDFIRVKPSTTYSSTPYCRYVLYDKDGSPVKSEYLTGGSEVLFRTFDTTESTAFVKFAYETSRLDVAQCNEGSTLLEYEPYNLEIDGIKLIGEKEQNNENSTSDDRFVVGNLNPGSYTAPIIPAKDLTTFTSDDIFALYDALVAAYPNYITKTICGQDSLGSNIYRYDFKPSDFERSSTAIAVPKMILCAGVHGNERAGVYNLYESMNQICKNWSSDETLEVLRWDVHYIVIPIVNVYGFTNNTKFNPNNVNIARNFPSGWVKIDDPMADNYGGTEPLSELETQCVDQVLQENTDAIYFGSYHNFFSDVHPHFFIWNAAATKLQLDIGKYFISKMSRKFKKDHTIFPQDETSYLGWANMGAPLGSEGRHASVAYGIQGGTFETCVQVMLESEPERYSSLALTLGTEAFINWLALNLQENVKFYNSL
ncbi:MAG: DUF2817 domain-containing protein, partial [Bacteroidales bacterium]|nr:DUF2817 domain-containing protein [Bacteroidales bacterium]